MPVSLQPSLRELVAAAATIDCLDVIVTRPFSFGRLDYSRVLEVGSGHRLVLSRQARNDLQRLHARYDYAIEATIFLAYCLHAHTEARFDGALTDVFGRLIAQYQESNRKKSRVMIEEDLFGSSSEHLSAVAPLWREASSLSRNTLTEVLHLSRAHFADVARLHLLREKRESTADDFCYVRGYTEPVEQFKYAVR